MHNALLLLFGTLLYLPAIRINFEWFKPKHSTQVNLGRHINFALNYRRRFFL